VPPVAAGAIVQNDGIGANAGAWRGVARGQVKRVGTAGDVLQESINSPLLTSTTAMHSKGREVLAKAGMVETHSLLMPITQEFGQCLPSELVAFNGDWWGITDGVSGSFSYGKVTQTTSIERVNRE